MHASTLSGLNSPGSGHEREEDCCEDGDEPSDTIKAGNFFILEQFLASPTTPYFLNFVHN